MTRKGKGDIMWNEKEHPRDILGRFTKKEIDNMTAYDLKEIILSSQKSEYPKNTHIILSRYINSSEPIYEYAKRIQHIEGYEDQVIHGDKYGFEINDLSGKSAAQYTAQEFADVLREDPNYHGGNIRLISCETGSGEDCVAQELADILGVDVLAPSDKIYLSPDGTMKIGKTGSGKWILFRKR